MSHTIDDLAAQGSGPSADPALVVEAVSKSFAGTRAVDRVSFEVRRGEFLAIVGPSGSGKTTTMRLIGGFEQPDEGRVLIGGRDVTGVPAERRDVSTVFQSYALFPHLSVFGNVVFGPRMRGVPRAERNRQAERLLELVRLDDVAKRRPHELSGGMQQRVALARALANAPSVLLFDEPLGALDRKLRDEMQVELRRIQKELGSTFVYITHDQDEAFGMADRLAVMRAGRIVQLGDPAEVYDRPVDAWVAQFVGDANVVRGVLSGVQPAGEAARLESDLGPIQASRVQGVSSGGRALAIVRPEATRIVPDPGGHGRSMAWAPGGPSVAEGTASAGPRPAAENRIPARLVDAVTVGSRIQLRAETAGGVVFQSRVPRDGQDGTVIVTPGDRVRVEFPASSVALYGQEPVSD